jgi:cysteine desulfurase
MKPRIFLDNNATTAVDPRVAQAIAEELAAPPSNPSSVHAFGQEAKKRLLAAREAIAEHLLIKPHEMIFTSGGTESMNLLIHGILADNPHVHLISSDIEHACVYHTLRRWEKQGTAITFLSAGLWGAIAPDAIAQAVRPNTRAIILSAANSETGVKNDIETIAAIAQERNIPLIVDGVALLGKELFSIPTGVAAMGFSSHKLHGPKGVGFAWARSTLSLSAWQSGGDQEYGRRAGTENLPGIIGLAAAIKLLREELPSASERMRQLRDRLQLELCSQLDPVIVNGQGPRITNTCNLSFPGVHGEDLLIALDLAGIAVSHGSACSSGALEPSRVLTQMGIPHQEAKSAIRFSLSRFTTDEEIDRCIEAVVLAVRKLRS